LGYTAQGQGKNDDAEKELLRLINKKIKINFNQRQKIKAMKKNSENNFTPLSEEQVKTLTTTVKETLATGFNKPRIFSAADLWNIQRRGRTMVSRRNFA
jgi:hypothetical protein